MKTLLTVALLTSFLFAGNLTVEITNIKKAEGVLFIALFNSQASYDAEVAKPIDSAKVIAKIPSSSTTFASLPDGVYTIKIFHDENGNGKMDTLFGIPKEAYGFSNNARGKMGPPSYEQAKFIVAGDTKHTIRIK